MIENLGWVLLVLVGITMFTFWWVMKSFDMTEGLRRWAEEMRDEDKDERG